jgi:hypothetical protein
MGYCVQDRDANWCTAHNALKFPGEEACRVMTVAYVLAESVAEAMEDLISAEIRAIIPVVRRNADPIDVFVSVQEMCARTASTEGRKTDTTGVPN